MNHYYTNSPELKHERIEFEYTFNDCRYSFISDAGVFSKNHVDEASDLLIHNIPPLNGKLLDMGCGYGCIGIVLGKAYGLEVTLSDVNDRALALAVMNAKENSLDVNVINSNCFDNIHEEFDTIVTNPPIRAGKQIIFQMYEGALAHLKKTGALYVVIQEKHGAASTKKKLDELFGAGQSEVIYKKKGYRIYVAHP